MVVRNPTFLDRAKIALKYGKAILAFKLAFVIELGLPNSNMVSEHILNLFVCKPPIWATTQMSSPANSTL